MQRNNKGNGDVLGSLFQGSSPVEAIPGLDELTSVIEKYSRPLLNNHEEKPSTSPQPVPTSPSKKRRKKGSGKTKTTHYLTKEVFNDLDQANNFLRGLLPTGSKLLATKSNIVNLAVKTLLEDFESNQKESALVKKLLKNNIK